MEELFSDVIGGSQSSIKIESQLPIWKAGKVYRLQAVKDIHNLNLTWTLPCLRKEYLKKPDDYLAHLLGHGKLFHILIVFCWKNSKLPTFCHVIILRDEDLGNTTTHVSKV